MEISPALHDLRTEFMRCGHDIRIVGGAVRDFLLGEVPKDIDLCTDATPDEQMALYAELGLRFIPTGLQHGTVTVLLDGEPMEITTLRTEEDHDGRHATVRYTRDWAEDMGRRDLTVNAMAMTFDGTLIDPFGGKDDLLNRRIRFVGTPEARMREDYLRVLRWLRFHARLAGNAPLDAAASQAAIDTGSGLAGISRERVWSEVKRMLVNPAGVNALRGLHSFGLFPHVGLPSDGLDWDAAKTASVRTGNPLSVLAALLRDMGKSVLGANGLPRNWKWSGEEERLFVLLVTHQHRSDMDGKGMTARDGMAKDDVVFLLDHVGDADAANELRNWTVLVFPVGGNDLLEAGFKPGPEMGRMLKSMKERWAASNFTAGLDELLDTKTGLKFP